MFGSEKICVELEECSTVGSVLRRILLERNVPLGLDDLLLTSNGRSIGFDEDTCSIRLVEVYRLLHGG